MKRKINVLLTMSFITAIASCSNVETSNSESSYIFPSESILDSEITTDSTTNSDESFNSESTIISENSSLSETISEKESTDVEIDENFEFPSANLGNPTTKIMSELKDYVPKTFDASTYKTSKTVLHDGVDLYKCDYQIDTTASGKITAYCLEVDLNKANIVAGCTENNINMATTKSVPTSQADAWEKDNPGKKAIAVTNADYFGSTCVNAFVKDGKIVKDSHNQTPDDLPVSSPMLFGVSSSGARIGAMTTSNNQKTDYTSKLSYKPTLTVFSKDGNVVNSLDSGKYNAGNKSTAYSICKGTGRYYFAKGFVYKVKFIQENKCDDDEIRGCLIEKTEIDSPELFEITEKDAAAGIGYFAVGSKLEIEYDLNSYVYYYQYLSSPIGGIWDYYDTILGCRHSLVENGILAPTVSSETSNGAKSRVPRTAVGIKPNGNVVIVSVEDLHYGKKATNCTGLTLTQLADFMRYYGCYDAANFDGGGSSQLSTKTLSETTWSVITKSSDTGSSLPTSTRKVMNTIIVTTK